MNEHSNAAGSHQPPDWDAADESVYAALQNIQPPAGSRERVRARLREMATLDALQANSPAPAASRSAERPLLTRRRLLGLATAAAAGGVVVGYYRSRPISREQLASRCVDQLNGILEQPPQWQSGDSPSLKRLSPLLQSLRELPRLVGWQRIAATGLAERGIIWKFALASGKSLYVLDWQDARQVSGLGDGLQVIQRSSGSWSLAALQRSDRILVAAVEGAIGTYLKAAPLA